MTQGTNATSYITLARRYKLERNVILALWMLSTLAVWIWKP